MSRQQREYLHQTLRGATAAAHHALDHHWLLQRLTGVNLTRERYAQSLAAMHRPHARLERRVHDSRHHVESGLALSPRLGRLEADLLDLDWAIPSGGRGLPDIADDYPSWCGRVYVLEGSRLGSVAIARCIRSSLGDTVPRRFFDEAATPGNFRALLLILERELKTPDALQQAGASALEAFADYQAELDAFDHRNRGTGGH